MIRLQNLGWMLLAALLTGCASVPINLPAITDQPTNVRQPGRIVWHDLLTDKPAESQRFYEELFGWEFSRIGPNFGPLAQANYLLIRHEGRLIGGMIDENRLNNDKDISQWVVLMSTDDIDGAVAALERAGGTVFTPPTDLADRGRIAVVTDPEGALFALLQTRDGDPPELEPQLNGFLWNELWTDDPTAAASFYADIVGVDKAQSAFDDGGVYYYMSADGAPRFGLLQSPLDGIPALWATYVRVADVAATVARVEALGGRVLLEPQQDPRGGQVALIADPSGAGFALQTWEPDNRLARNEE
ncbi:MAG: VOC family protein [Gammaproteobacteria bacterium]